MIEYNIKTWRCTGCDFAYSGAIPPTAEQNAVVFSNAGLRDFECPNCRTPTLERATDPEKKARHRVLELEDLPAVETELQEEPPRHNPLKGRKETGPERAARIKSAVDEHKTRIASAVAQRPYFECDL